MLFLQATPEIRAQIQEVCTNISLETGRALKDLATSVKKMNKPSSADAHIASSKAAAKSLRSLLKSGLWENTDLLEVIPSVTVALLLLDVVNCTEKIAESVHELASLAHFKSTSLDPNVSPEKSKSKIDCPRSQHVVVTINTESAPTLKENGNPRPVSIHVGV